jgi:hypothetical protein
MAGASPRTTFSSSTVRGCALTAGVAAGVKANVVQGRTATGRPLLVRGSEWRVNSTAPLKQIAEAF